MSKGTGTSINDVALAICAGALKRYLADCGCKPDKPLIAAVPVSLREPGNIRALPTDFPSLGAPWLLSGLAALAAPAEPALATPVKAPAKAPKKNAAAAAATPAKTRRTRAAVPRQTRVSPGD
jgi:diacylglycerol O-acyltransferase / wax synthase